MPHMHTVAIGHLIVTNRVTPNTWTEERLAVWLSTNGTLYAIKEVANVITICQSESKYSIVQILL